MVCSGDDNHMAWKSVDLQKQRTDNPLYLTGFVCVPALFAQRVELIKEEDAMMRTREIKQSFQPPTGFAEKATYDSLIAHDEKRNHQLIGQGLS